MTIKEFFADYSEEYADVFILDSEDDGDAYRGTVYPFNGEISIDFSDETPNPAAMRKAKQTAQQQQYEITRAYRSGTIQTGYRATDITAEFLRA